jgi:valyl-tRNA synthetase
MSEIPKAYEPQSVESKWYQFWLDRNAFTADPARISETRPAYSIVIPPPNVTGVLTLGHVLNNTIQDILARKARMDGKEVLWLPGTDHAGIATQTVVERTLKKAGEIKHRNDLGREKFLERVWEWKEKHGGIILQQLKALGASCDWTRTRFTMDPEYSRCVTRVFVDLYKKGLIYRGKRMVNWCPVSLTALSDEEVIMKEQKGFMYHFKVEVADVVGQAPPPVISPASAPACRTAGEGASPTMSNIRSTGMFLTIATTRPETIPGDTAVAVNPKDTRYAHLIGKHVVRPLPAELPREQKLIPIIGDEYVDFEFGTGVLKVTPAHDKADFEIGQRHKLRVVDIMNPDATMNALAGGPLAGLDRFKARKVAVELLTELGSLEKEEPYTNNVGFSERADVPIEPRLSEQWFLKYPSVEKSKNCVAQEEEGSTRAPRVAVGALADSTGRATSFTRLDSPTRSNAADEASAATREARVLPEKMHFYPQRWAKVYDHWMTGIQDWCISRQLWWGHRIPVWAKRVKKTRAGAYNEVLTAFFMDEAMSYARAEIAASTCRINGVDVSLSNPKEWQAITESEAPEDNREQEFEIVFCTNSSDLGEALDQLGFTQDPDVLDTWFSSWLWPFATMHWTGNAEIDAKNDTLKKFYPTTDLVTGPDIIFFWVARMIMAGYEYMGEMPFRNVYFTGIIRDKQGRKMSKSLGNSPDPLDLINTYGADALRFGIMRSAPQGQDLLFDEQSVELGRNFCNKLWNACRFRQMQGGESEGEINTSRLTSDDKWILLKLDSAIREVTDALNNYKFNEAANALYRFFWSEYCDWYVESTKAVLDQRSEVGGQKSEGNLTTAEAALQARATERRANTLAVMDFVLSNTLRLFHPFLPFITEELWQGMGFNDDLPKEQGGDTIMFANWPKPFDKDMKEFYALDDCYIERVENKHELVRQGRNLRREARIASNVKARFVLKPLNDLPPHDIAVIRILLNAEPLEVNTEFQSSKGTARAITPMGELFLPLEGLIDVAAERTRLQKELEEIRSEIEKVSQKLSNPSFSQKAPPKVLAEHQQRLTDWNAKHAQVLAALEGLGAN